MASINTVVKESNFQKMSLFQQNQKFENSHEVDVGGSFPVINNACSEEIFIGSHNNVRFVPPLKNSDGLANRK